MPVSSLAQQPVSTDAPHTISYQGLLVNRDGFPLPDGDHSIYLRLYVDSLGQHGVWQTLLNVRTRNGLFNAILGAPYTEPLPPIADLDTALYLGVQVDGHIEMRPLTPVTGVMYALNVADSAISTRKIQVDAVTTPNIRDNAVTTPKIAPDFVGKIYVGSKSTTWKAGDFELDFGNNMKWYVDTLVDTIGGLKHLVRPRLNINVPDQVIRPDLRIVVGPGIKLLRDNANDIDTLSIDSIGIREWMMGDKSVSTRVLDDNSVTSAKILDHEVHGIDVNADIAGRGLVYGVDNKLHVKVGSGLFIDTTGALNVDLSGIKLTVDPDKMRGIDTANGKVFAKVDGTTIGYTTTGELTLVLMPHTIHGQHLNADVADGVTIVYNPNTNQLEVKDGGISTIKLRDGAVTNAKLADSAVTSSKIFNGAITTVKIADSAVTTTKLANGAVTHGKLGTNSVDSTNIIDGGISYNNLAQTTIDQLKTHITSNRYTQTLRQSPVVGSHDSTAVLQAAAIDPSNGNPVITATSVSNNGGVLFQGDATGVLNGATLLELQQFGIDKFVVSNNGDLNVNTNKFHVTALDGSLNIGPNFFIVSGATGATSILDGTSSVAYSLNVSNTQGNLSTTGAASFSGSNRTGLGTRVTRTPNGATFSAVNASLGVTRGAVIDSLTLPATNGYVNFDNGNVSLQNGQLNLTGTTVTGLTGNNKFSQTATAAIVGMSASINAGVEIQMSGANTDPAILANTAAGVATSGDLLQLQKGGAPVFQVGNTGDLTINTNKFTVAAATGATNAAGDLTVNTNKFKVSAVDGSVNVGPGLFTIAGASGQTTILDATTNAAFSLNVTNSSGGVGTGGAAAFSAANRTGFGTTVTRTPNGATFSAANASFSVTRGAVIDTLNISSRLQFSNNAVVDFSGVTVTGLAGNNKFTQTATAATVAMSPSTSAGVEVQLSGANTDPAILANTAAGIATSGDLLQLQKGGTAVFQVGNGGDLSINTNKFTVAAATGATNAAGDVTVNTNKFKVTAADGSVNIGPGNFMVAGATGATTIVDASSNVAYSLSVTNTQGGISTTGAAAFSGSNRTGFGTNITRSNNGATFSTTNASLGVTRGAVIDSLRLPATNGFVNFDNGNVSIQNGQLNLTGTTITGLSNGNKFTQTATGAIVNMIASTAAGVEVQLSGLNTDPVFIGNTAAGISTSGDLLQLQKGGTPVFQVGNTGDLTINTNKFTVVAATGATNAAGDLTVNTNKFKVSAVDGSVNVGPGNFTVAGTTGVTTIVDPSSNGAYTLNVSNTQGSTSTTGAATFSGSNRTGFGTNVTRSTNGATFSTTNASLGVTRGAVIDSLRLPAANGFVNFDNGNVSIQNSQLNLSGTTIVGLSSGNKFAQTATGGTVAMSASIVAGVEVQLSGANTDPVILGNTAAGVATSGDLLQLQKGGSPVFQVGNTGDLAINTNKFKVTATDGSINVGPGTFTVTGATGVTTITDATSAAPYTFSVTNSQNGFSTTGAATFSGSNRTGFATNITRNTNGATFSTVNASLGVTRGAVIDSLRLPAANGYVNFDNGNVTLQNGTLNLTGTTVLGLVAQSNNKFSQNATGAAVVTAQSINAGAEVQMSGSNTDPAILANAAAGVATSGDLLQLQKGGAPVFQVGNTGDLTINTNKFTVAAATGATNAAGDLTVNTNKFKVSAVDGSVNVGPGLFTIAGASGQTTILDATTNAAFSLNVTNSSGGVGTGGAAAFSAANRTGFGTTIIRNTNGATFSTLNASLGVTRGAVIDSLRLPATNGYVNFDNGNVTLQNGQLNLTGTTVTGLSGNNKFTQAVTGGTVAMSASTASGVEVQLTGSNTDPVFIGNTAAGIATSGDLLQLQKGGTSVFQVGNTGDLTINANKFTVAAATGATNAAGDFTVNTNKFKVTAVDGSVNIGPGNFTIAGTTGVTTLIDASSVGAYSLNVSNTQAGTSTTGAATFSGSNRTGFGTNVTRSTNGAKFSTTNASLGVTRGAVIDSLTLPASNGYVNFDNGNVTLQNGTLNLTNTTVIGLTSGANKFAQSATGAAVAMSLSTNGGVEIQMSGTNTDPGMIINAANGAATSGDLLDLQKNNANVFQVANGGKTTINDNATTAGYSLNVTNSANGTTTGTGGAATFTGANRTGFTTNLTRTSNGVTFSPTDASLGVTRGAVIDSLSLSATNGFASFDNANMSFKNGTLNLTGTTVIGLTGNNFSQTATSGVVSISSSVAAGVIAQMSGTNTDPAFLALSTSPASGDLMDLRKDALNVFQVGNTGNLTIGASKFTVNAGTGATDAEGDLTVATNKFKVAASDGSVNVGPGNFTVTGATGVTTIVDATSNAAYSLNVSNTQGATSTTGAASFSGSNRTGFGTNVTRSTNGAKFSATSASLGVTRGAVIDSLTLPATNGYVNFDNGNVTLQNGTLNLTGTTIIGLSSGNKFAQTVTGGTVSMSPSTNSGVEVQLSGTNTDPVFIGNTAAGVLTSGDLLQLQKGGTPVFQVGNTGDLAINTNKFKVAALDGSVNVGPGNFTVAGATGVTTILDATSSAAYSLNVSNTQAGTSTTGAATFSGSNRTGFGTKITRTTNGATFSATNASLGVTRGAVIDSLTLPASNGYVNFDNGNVTLQNGTLNLTGTTIIGLSSGNKFAQTITGGTVSMSPSTNSGVEVQLSGTNTDPVFIGNTAAGVLTSGDLLQLQKGGTPVFQVGNTGDLAINANKFKVTASDGSINVGPGTFTVTGATGVTTILDATSSAAYSLNVSNTQAGTSTTGAATFSGSNRTGFGTKITRSNNGATFSATNASLGVTRGAVIDSLTLPTTNGYVNFDNGNVTLQNGTLNLTGTTVIGLSIPGNNKFTQSSTGGAVILSTSTTSGVEIQMTGTNTDPGIVVNSASGVPTSGDLLRLQKGGSTVVKVNNSGNTTVTVATGTGVSSTTSSVTSGDAGVYGKASNAGTAGVVAEGNGTSAPGTPNANALEIRNGGIFVSGSVKPVGLQTATILAGHRYVKVTVSHVLVQSNSLITVIVTGTGGSAASGTDHDTFTGTVRSKTAGSFVIDVSCNNGDAPVDENVNIEYSIINQ